MKCGASIRNPVSEITTGFGLYVHVAYCRRKCIYCDFFSAGERIADWPRYVDALCAEFKERIEEMAWPLRTVYFGGGTPSLMPETEFRRLCAFLKPYMATTEEFTIEVNPDDVSDEMLQIWRDCGVNRLSMGIQTFSDQSLSAIGRRHDSKTALQAYAMSRKYFRNVSIDLMFGLPYQTYETWRKDLQTAIRLRPEHISAYSLMYEEGTVLTALRDTGRIMESPEETTEKMFLMLINELARAGYEHYEISNFALPGFRSRHNSSYWLQMPYIGIGPSAHSYDGVKTRKANIPDLKGYLEYWMPSVGDIPLERKISYQEHLSKVELLEEYVMTRLRMREGIPLKDFEDRFGQTVCLRLIEKGRRLAEMNRVEMDDYHISISENSIMMSDSIILELADLD